MRKAFGAGSDEVELDDVYDLLLARGSTEKLVQLSLSWVAGDPHNRNLRVASDFTHEEMAQMIGSSPKR